MEKKIPKRILNSLINSLSAGVVPRSGAPYIAIGRNEEVGALLEDLGSVADGGSALRFLIGRYGSGKSFLLQLIRGYALEKGFVTADADLSPERRLCGTGGAGIATYRELIRNLSCKTSPDGGALPVIISRWLSDKQGELAASGIFPESPEFAVKMKKEVYAVGAALENSVGGFDFATVLYKYYDSTVTGDDERRSDCLRWLRGEYRTRTEARRQLGVSSIIDDDNWYDYLKLLAVFCNKIGYMGMTVYIDECVNLYKITNRVSRENNYEKILSIFNDTLQGKAPYLGFVFVGTPQFLEDTRRGLFSYEALRSRLADCTIVSTGFRNLSGPIIRLVRLTDEELYALMSRLNFLFAMYSGEEIRITQEQMRDFLSLCLSRAGADTMVTPREIIRSYLTLLQLMRQNPEAAFRELLSEDSVSRLSAPSDPDEGDSGTVIEDFDI
ncbi:MAG: ATP-binding protein [Clostridia bacterium]|nr:ATP-binding protein [Clostridia bacterium]